MRTDQEVQDEIKTLEELKPQIPPRSSFGSNNWAMIDAQIETLRERYDHARIDQVWGDLDEAEADIYHEANEALAWRLGDSNDPPSKEWAGLVGVKPKYIGSPDKPIVELNKIKPKTGKKPAKTAAKARKQRKLTGV